MFKNIIKYFRVKRERKQILRVVKLSHNLIFSEKYDLSIETEVEKFKIEIKNICKNQIQVLQSYLIINSILQYTCVSIEETNLSSLSFLINDFQYKSKDEELLSLKIQVEESKLSINLLMIDAYVKAGKEAFEKNEYSYKGMIYRLEKAKKSAATLEEKKEFKNISEEIDKHEGQK